MSLAGVLALDAAEPVVAVTMLASRVRAGEAAGCSRDELVQAAGRLRLAVGKATLLARDLERLARGATP